MNLGNLSTNDAQTVVNLFADHFTTAYAGTQTCNGELISDVSYTQDDLGFLSDLKIDISLEQVFDLLSNLKLGNTYGPDRLTNTFLVSCKYSLSKPISLLFERSLREGIFPQIWKISYIKPVFKSGSRYQVENYRGVCQQSILPKLLDSFVAKKLSEAITPYLSLNQHGFVRGRSVLSNLLEYSDQLSSELENGGQVDAIYMDFAKAFDRVNHECLLIKLKQWKLPERTISWIKSFVTGRTQKVKIGGLESSDIGVPSGVPQGSHCGPVLFLLFIDDIVSQVKSAKILLFADDIKIFKPINSYQDCIALQQDLDGISRWCENNKLYLNTSKCYFIRFTRCKTPVIFDYVTGINKVLQVDVIKDLGVIFDSKLSFKQHIFSISMRARKLWGFIARSCANFDIIVLKTLYISLVRSVLEYSAPVWSPYFQCNIDLLERVQKRFLRFIEFKMGIVHVRGEYTNILSLIQLQTLQKRRIYIDLCTLHKIINKQIFSEYSISLIQFYQPSNDRITRHMPTFKIPYKSTRCGQNLGLARLLREANEYTTPQSFSLSLPMFKNRMWTILSYW